MSIRTRANQRRRDRESRHEAERQEEAGITRWVEPDGRNVHYSSAWSKSDIQADKDEVMARSRPDESSQRKIFWRRNFFGGVCLEMK